ncbi:MAG: DUF5808 domain-containing protein [Gemmatimonadota bacterium]
MSEVVVVNLFLWVRVFLVGGIFLMFPRITRKGLLFGVYVGEEFAEGDEARGVLRGWDRGCVMVMASALFVGLVGTLAGHAVAGNLTGTAVLLLGGVGLYLRSYSRVRAFARPDVTRQGGRATAALGGDGSKAETVARITLGICLVSALATIAFALMNYQAMGTRLPTLWSLIGGADGWTEKSYLYAMYVPTWNLVLGQLFALLALLIASAKRSLREGPGGRSAEAQDAFRAMTSYLFSGIALFYCALLTLFSVQVIRIGLSGAQSLGIEMLWIIGPMIVFIVVMGAGVFWIIRRYGQGGALMERGFSEGALTGGLADNARWVWGAFYVNPDDPSWFLESRFGIGYSTNWGNRKAALFNIVSLALILSLVVLGFFL